MRILVNNLTFMAVHIGDYTFDYINNLSGEVGYELYHKDGTFIDSEFMPPHNYKNYNQRTYTVKGVFGETLGEATVSKHGFTLTDKDGNQIIEVTNNIV